MIVEGDIDPVIACEKIKAATDIRFFFSDRLEAEIEPAYLARTAHNEPRFDALFAEMGEKEAALLKEELGLQTAPVHEAKEAVVEN